MALYLFRNFFCVIREVHLRQKQSKNEMVYCHLNSTVNYIIEFILDRLRSSPELSQYLEIVAVIMKSVSFEISNFGTLYKITLKELDVLVEMKPRGILEGLVNSSSEKTEKEPFFITCENGDVIKVHEWSRVQPA